MESIAKAAASAILAYTVHYGTAKVYNLVCVPDGLLGYLKGFITTGSPVCQAGVQVITHTQTSYSSMFLMGITRVFIDLVAPGAAKPV
jgi:hypothetical protein